MGVISRYLVYRVRELPDSRFLALRLKTFVWLLTLQPAASGRGYATYGAIYIASALGWLWLVDGVSPTWTDVAGVALTLCGAAIIAMGQRLV